MALLNAKRVTIVVTLAEAARRFGRENPDQASKYVDAAVQFVNNRTHGRWHQLLGSGSAMLKKGLTGLDQPPTPVTPPVQQGETVQPEGNHGY